MFTWSESAAPQLQDAEIASGALGSAFRFQKDDRVRDTELRRLHRVMVDVLPDPERRDGERSEAPGQVVEESPEIRIVGCKITQRLEAVDDHDARTMRFHQRVDAFQDTAQAVAV